jgi:hypothetical protein
MENRFNNYTGFISWILYMSLCRRSSGKMNFTEIAVEMQKKATNIPAGK